jgi:F-type H+-transporting ATPase subunit delta
VADDSNATDAGQRYAQALFDLAKDQDAIAAVEADLRSLKAAMHESADLRRLLASPAFGADDKAKGLNAIAKSAKFNPTTEPRSGQERRRRAAHRAWQGP